MGEFNSIHQAILESGKGTQPYALGSGRCHFHGDKSNAHRLADFDGLPGPGQFAGLGIDAEDDHIVGVLIGGNQVLAGGINGKTARSFARGWIDVRQS